jgi:RHS repeat-associated protein
VYDRMHVAWSQDRAGNWTQYLVNPLRQPVIVRDPNGSITQMDWCGCGRLLALTDGNQHTTVWVPDEQNRTQIRRGSDGYETSYCYDGIGRLDSIEDARGQTTSFSYNKDDTIANITYSATVGTPPVSFNYDPQRGRLVSMTDGNGLTSYTYHPVGVLGADQLQSVQRSLANAVIAYGYDELGQVINRDINGAIQSWDRDEIDRVTGVTSVLGHFGYKYDVGLSKQVNEIDWPTGSKTTFLYDEPKGPISGGPVVPAGPDVTLKRISHFGSFGVVNFEYDYDHLDRITSWKRQWTNQSDRYDLGYDAIGQLTQGTRRNQTDNTVLSLSGYSYDDAGNRVSEQNDTALTRSAFDESNTIWSTQGGGPIRFAGQLNKAAAITVNGVPGTVDSRHRFEAEVTLSPGPHTITLVATDPNDNSTVTHDYQVNITAGNPRLYSRDQNGNITSSTSPNGSGAPNAIYEWDGLDRLTAINVGTHRTEIEYDGQGRRSHITEKENSKIVSEKRFVWCGDELCEERTANGTVTKRFFSQGEQRIGGADAGVYYYSRDHLGSIREMTDTSGNIRARYDYTLWGTRQKLSGDLDSDFGFTGFYFHNQSGLNFSRTRAYDAASARWLSQDPIGEAGGTNLSGYVFNDPVHLSDPTGLDTYWHDSQDTIAGFVSGFVPFLPYDSSNDAMRYGFAIGAVTSLAISGPGLALAAVRIYRAARAARTAFTLARAGLGCASEGTTSLETMLEKVGTLDFSTPANKAVFYSGPAQGTRAAAFAERTGSMTIEMTSGGRAMIADPLFQSLSPAEQFQVWQRASASFAEGAAGRVNAFIRGARPDRTFRSLEEPILDANSKVDQYIYHY